jgi:glutathione synthase/RimK-type ligase-like ATP-grasp enzyme
MIVCLYGATCAAFVEPVALDLQNIGREIDAEIVPVSVEAALREPWRWREADRVYVLPFDVPRALPEGYPNDPAALLRKLFPHAEIANSCSTHDLCWDKIATSQRLLARSVPMPDTSISDSPEEVRRFIREHEYAVLKQSRSCGGEGHLVVCCDDDGNIVGETRSRRYLLELDVHASRRLLADGVLSCPPPYYVQRLIAGVGRRGVLRPPQVLRAYVVGGQPMFWIERYRARCRRLSDFIINVGPGTQYRFLPRVSEEARKVALRAAEVLDVGIGVVDVVRAGGEGPYVLDVDTDGYHMLIDRQFKLLPEFRSAYDFDAFIAELLAAPRMETKTRVLV